MALRIDPFLATEIAENTEKLSISFVNFVIFVDKLKALRKPS